MLPLFSSRAVFLRPTPEVAKMIAKLTNPYSPSNVVTKIIKRDGRVVSFDSTKILLAIAKASQVTGETLPLGPLTDEVVTTINRNFTDNAHPATVEDCQDIVEDVLIEHNYAKTAKEYILYRANRSRVREAKTDLMSTIDGIATQDASENDSKRENANIDANTAMGTMLKFGSETAKAYYLEKMIDRRAPTILIRCDSDLPILSLVHQEADGLKLTIKDIHSRNFEMDGVRGMEVVVIFAFKSTHFAVDEFVEHFEHTEKVTYCRRGKFAEEGKE